MSHRATAAAAAAAAAAVAVVVVVVLLLLLLLLAMPVADVVPVVTRAPSDAYVPILD